MKTRFSPLEKGLIGFFLFLTVLWAAALVWTLWELKNLFFPSS